MCLQFLQAPLVWTKLSLVGTPHLLKHTAHALALVMGGRYHQLPGATNVKMIPKVARRTRAMDPVSIRQDGMVG